MGVMTTFGKGKSSFKKGERASKATRLPLSRKPSRIDCRIFGDLVLSQIEVYFPGNKQFCKLLEFLQISSKLRKYNG